MGLFDRRADKGTPFDWLVVGLGNPGQGVRPHPPQRRRGVRPAARRTSRRTAQGGPRRRAGRRARFGAGIDAERVVLAFPHHVHERLRQAVSGARAALRHRDDPSRSSSSTTSSTCSRRGAGQGRRRAGRHNGLRSITQHLKTQDFLRVRIGVGKPPFKERGADHVLSRVPARRTRAARRRRRASPPTRSSRSSPTASTPRCAGSTSVDMAVRELVT